MKMPKSVNVVSRIMESEVHNKVPEVVVNDMYDFLSHIENLTLYGPGNLRYKLYCFLYYAVRGIGYQKLETITRFPHSDCHQCFGCLRSKLYEWALSKIVPSKLKIRKAIAVQFVVHNQFQDCTLLIDSKDFKIEKQSDRGTKSKHHSFKENCHCIRVQFISTHDLIVRWISGPFTPKTYDADCVLKKILSLDGYFKKGDKVLADNHYTTVNRKKPRNVVIPTFVTKHPKPKNSPLSEEKRKFNEKHKACRAKIETNISQITNRFGWFSHPWMKDRSSLYQMVVIATAINNCVNNNNVLF